MYVTVVNTIGFQIYMFFAENYYQHVFDKYFILPDDMPEKNRNVALSQAIKEQTR